MSLKTLLVVTFLALFFQRANSQNNFEEYNLLGFNGGVTFFDITTSNFESKQGTGFVGGFTTRGTFYDNFDLIYGINFVSNQLSILSKDSATPSAKEQYVGYTIQGVQITFLASYNLVRHHFTIEVGPVFNINGKMKLNSDALGDNIIANYQTLKASEIQNISKVNFHVLGGISTGIRNVRLSAHYQYGVTNTFKALNDQDIEKDSNTFKGNSSSYILLATIYL